MLTHSTWVEREREKEWNGNENETYVIYGLLCDCYDFLVSQNAFARLFVKNHRLTTRTLNLAMTICPMKDESMLYCSFWLASWLFDWSADSSKLAYADKMSYHISFGHFTFTNNRKVRKKYSSQKNPFECNIWSRIFFFLKHSFAERAISQHNV